MYVVQNKFYAGKEFMFKGVWNEAKTTWRILKRVKKKEGTASDLMSLVTIAFSVYDNRDELEIFMHSPHEQQPLATSHREQTHTT